MKRERDFQKSAVYAWEGEFFNKTAATPLNADMSLAECNALIALIFSEEGRRKPKVRDGRGRRAACFQSGNNTRRPGTIKLPRWARRRWVVIHETAHALVRANGNLHSPAHGATFVRTYIDLLVSYHGQNVDALEASARAAKVKFIERNAHD